MITTDESGEVKNEQTEDVNPEQQADVKPEEAGKVRTGISKGPFVAFWVTVSAYLLLFAITVVLSTVKVAGAFLRYVVPAAILLLAGFGIALIVLAVRDRGIFKGLRRALILTGISAVGMPVFAILHNVVYGLMIAWLGEDIWAKLGMGDEEPYFFLLAVIVCPLLFVASAIYVIFVFAKGKRKSK